MEEINRIENELNKTLDKTEIKYIQKWVNKFNYNYIVIKLAMEFVNSTEITYLDEVVTEWYEKGLKTKEDIITWIESVYKTYDKHTEKILEEKEIQEKIIELKNKTLELFYIATDVQSSVLERTHSNINPFLKQLSNITDTSLKWVDWFSKYDKFLK